MSDILEWTRPDENGLQTCPAHPSVAPFRGLIGCSGCHESAPDDMEPAPTTDENAASRFVEEHRVHEANERGAPDAIELELRAAAAWRETKRELRTCRRIATELEQRARDVRDRKVESAEPERDAMRWFAEAAKYRALAAKSVDTATKAIKQAQPAAETRFRAASLLERARALAGRRSH